MPRRKPGVYLRRSLRLLALALWIPLSGCSLTEMGVDTMVPVFVKAKDEFNKETVVRYAREAAPGMLATLDSFALGSPENEELRLLQAEMHFSFGFGLIEDEDPVWAVAHYRKSRRAALAALAQEDEDLAAEIEAIDVAKIPERLVGLDDDAAPPLFWWAMARGAEINLNKGDPGQVAQVGRVDAVMEWVLGKDDTYFNGGPHLYFAMRHLALPVSLGGDPQKGLPHFEAVDRLTHGKHLLPKVMKAKFYAPGLAATAAGATVKQVLAAQQAAWSAYFDGLKAVLDAPDDLWPEQRLSNAIAKQRALALLEDPEGNNIIPPKDAQNPYSDEGNGDWGDGDGDGDWGD